MRSVLLLFEVRKYLLLISLHVIAILVPGHKAEASVTCTAGDFTVGERAFIQCYFNKDVKQTKHNFNVVRHPLDHQPIEDSSVYVLLCNWHQNEDSLQCKVETGYSFNHTVSSSFTLDIPAVAKVHTGKYVCQLVPDEGSKVETCTLTMRESTQSLLLAILVLVIVLLLIAIAHVVKRICSHQVQRLKQLISSRLLRNRQMRSHETCTYSNRLGGNSAQGEGTSLTEAFATRQKKELAEEAADIATCSENSNQTAEDGNREKPQSSAATKSAMQEKEADARTKSPCILQ